MKSYTLSQKILAVLCAVVLMTSGLMLPSTAETPSTGFTEITFSDYRDTTGTTIADGFYEAGTETVATVGEKLSSLEGVAFNGIIKFTGDVPSNPQNAGIRIGGSSQWNSWPGITIYYDNGIVLYNYTGMNDGPLCHVTETDPVSLKNKEAVIRLTFQTENKTDVRISFSVDGTEYYNDVVSGLSGKLGHGMLLARYGAGYEIKSYLPDQEPKYRELTFSDYGISDGTYEAGSAGAAMETSKVPNLENVSFTGTITFAESGGRPDLDCIRIGGLNQYNTWTGLGIYYDNGIVLWDYTGTTTENGGWICHVTEDDTISFRGKPTTIRLTFEYINDNQDVRLGFWVNGIKHYSKTVFGLAEKLGTGLLISTKSAPITVKSFVLQKMPSDRLKDITLADFGIAEDKTVTTDAYGTYEGDSLDGTRLTMYLTLPERLGGTYLRFGGTEATGGWDGFGIKAWKSGNIELELSDNSGNTDYIDYCSRDVAKTSMLNRQIKLAITTEFIDADRDGNKNDVMYGIYFNDVLYNNQPVVLKNHVDHVGKKVLFYTDTVEYPIELKLPKILTLDDLGFVSGKYDNSYYVEEQYEDTLMNTVLTQKVTFSEHAGTWLNYAGSFSWGGIRFVTQEDGTIVIRNAGGEFTTEYVLDPKIAKTDLLGKELELKLELYQSGEDAKLGVYINGKLYNNQPFHLGGAANNFGGYVGYYVAAKNAYVELNTGVRCEQYNLAYGPYLLSGKGMNNGTEFVTVNGGGMADWTVSTPGDYTIRSTGDGAYKRRIVLYYYGDAHPDGEIDVRDLIAVKKSLEERKLTSESAKKGADVDGNGIVNIADLNSIRDNLLGPQKIQNVKDNAIYYAENVMPIGGYCGPRRTTDKNGLTYDYLTDECYRMIKDLGVNLITYTTSIYHTDENDKAEIIEGLTLAEKYGLGVFVRDGRLGGKTQMPAYNFSGKLSDFVQYTSFKGFAVIDEPYTSYYGYKYWIQNRARLEDYDEIAANVNSYTNSFGYVNLNPMLESLGSTYYKDDYDRYLEEYIRLYNARLLSFDYYPFDANASKVGYFENLSVFREKALKHNIPFWAFIQAGTNWNDNISKELSPTVNNTPTKGEMLWNVNTSLAYGAKGIQYFPLIQPPYFSYTTKKQYDYERNGLIGANGVANKWYYYAQDANRQIAAVDEVLMNAKSIDVLAIGSSAQADTGISNVFCESLESSNPIVAPNGAIVGVFDYQGKTAFYVVNYDTENSQNVTVNFDGTKQYSIISAAQNESTSGQACVLNLEAGGAALIVMK